MALSNDEISELVTQFEDESKAIKKEILKMCWYMRGGLTYDEAVCLGQQERIIISKLIDENLETVKKTGLPFF